MRLKRSDLAAAMAEIEHRGLTPFDLVEWTHLLNIAWGYRFGIDLGVSEQIRDELAAALRRKAELLEAEEDGQGFYVGLAKSATEQLGR